MRLNGKTALITGAGQGLGEAFARRFAEEGAQVAIADINGANAEQVALSIRDKGHRAISIQVNVADIGQVESMVADTIRQFGAVDILVNSAGIFDVASIDDTTEAIWDRTMSINLKGTFFAVKAAAPDMRRRKRGKIVNLTSIAGLGGFLNCPAYCASKGAIVNLTKALACELAPFGITVNAVGPGPVETPINKIFNFDNPQGDAHRQWLRERTPSGVDFFKIEDITGTVLFLSSSESDAVTGVTVPVDGGWCAW